MQESIGKEKDQVHRKTKITHIQQARQMLGEVQRPVIVIQEISE
jgi:hypothetical protein